VEPSRKRSWRRFFTAKRILSRCSASVGPWLYFSQTQKSRLVRFSSCHDFQHRPRRNQRFRFIPSSTPEARGRQPVADEAKPDCGRQRSALSRRLVLNNRRFPANLPTASQVSNSDIPPSADNIASLMFRLHQSPFDEERVSSPRCWPGPHPQVPPYANRQIMMLLRRSTSMCGTKAPGYVQVAAPSRGDANILLWNIR
jgi:hypothetical protein